MIWVCTVCSNLSVLVIRSSTVAMLEIFACARICYKNHVGMQPQLKVIGGIEDNSKIIFLIPENICCDPS